MNQLAVELERLQPRLKAIAPAGCQVDEIIQNVVWAVGRDEDLSRCSIRSLIEAVMEALAMGLDPSGLTGDGVLVPRKTKSGGFRATFVPDYRALMRLVLSHPRISHIEARVVRSGDEFELCFGDPDDHIVRHRPRISATSEEPIGAYAIAWFRDSFRPLVEWMTKEEIESNAERGGSMGSDNSPWETDWGEMARKTVTKRLLKYLPLRSSADLVARTGAALVSEGNPTTSETNGASSAIEAYRLAISEADSEQIDLVIKNIREDDSLDHHEKTELFNLATARKKELKGVTHARAITTDR